MKKIMIVLFFMAATMNLMAQYTAKAKLTLSDGTESCDVYLIQKDALSDGFNSGWCSTINMEGRTLALYAIYSSANYQTFGTKNLGAMPFGLKTSAATSYSITVTSVEGTETLKMMDTETGTIFDLTEGYVYNFTAAANQTANTTRFHLYVAPSTPEICHRYGKLQVSGSNGQNVVVKNMDDSATSIGTVAITADYQEIAVEGVLTPGQYKVEWNSQTLIIDVK